MSYLFQILVKQEYWILSEVCNLFKMFEHSCLRFPLWPNTEGLAELKLLQANVVRKQWLLKKVIHMAL